MAFLPYIPSEISSSLGHWVYSGTPYYTGVLFTENALEMPFWTFVPLHVLVNIEAKILPSTPTNGAETSETADTQKQVCCFHSGDGNACGPEKMPLVCCGEDFESKLEQTERCFKLFLSSRGPGFGRSLLHLLLVPSGLSVVLSRAVMWLHLSTTPWWFPVSSFQNIIHQVLITISIQSTLLTRSAHWVLLWCCSYANLWVLCRDMRSLSSLIVSTHLSVLSWGLKALP